MAEEMLSVVVLCLCLASAVNGLGNSLKDPYICGPPTCAVSDKFKYIPETIYHYEYKVNVETYFNGSSNNRSTLDIRAETIIQLIKPCEGLLQLRDVTLIDQDESYPVERAEKFIHALLLYDLRFAFHDGVISEICPEELEEEWVLNFKRAVLSLFQNSMKRFDINFKGVEQDIHGSCGVDYTIRGQEGTSLVLVKTRDLALCTNRYKYLSILQTVRYDFQSRFQTWPVLKSESKCRITVDHNIYKSVNCKERHLFEPFSGRNSGAMTTVIQDLVLMREVNKTDSQIMEAQPKGWMIIERRSNLLHRHNPHVKTETGELKSARDVLKLLCNINDNADDYVPGTTVDENLDSGSTVGLWGKLVRAARGLHYPALSQLLTRAPTICAKATKLMLDALPYVASAGSVELIKDMILRGEVDQNTRHEWLMSMAMIPRPKNEMLVSMLELLKQQRNDQVISFTVSSMVHSYCKHSGKSLRECCEEQTPKLIMEEFQNIVQEMSNINLATAPRAERQNITIAIKALGNIGGFKQEFADILMNIIGDALVPVPIRLSAVDAFRRTPCIETRDYFLETFRQDSVNIEVRIASYLQVMKCPTLSIIRKIYHSVRHEEVNQVATFVWSHLKNLGQSSLPSRVEIQGLLSGNPMPQLEDMPDFRMYSRNYEQSVFYDQYNAGGNYEANVIFTPESYIPRSVSLNLTVDMFGESINLLELKGRAEGFERYFENLFGNNGPLSKTKINDQIQNFRFIRSLADADDVRAKVDGIGYKNEALKHQYPMAELGIKVFGNEISFWHAEGNEEIVKSLERMNLQLRVLEILSGKEISYNKASLFLDTTFSVPTGCGLPLNMNLMGTSYVNTRMSGTMVDRFSQSRNLDFEGKIHPSVAVNIAATMSVTAGGLSSSGVRLNMRLYTATAVEAKLNIRGLGLVRLDLSLPSEKREIFAAKSELIILHGEEEKQQQGLNQNRIEQNTCSWSAFDQGIGIKVCASYQFPNMTNLPNAPYFIMSGPAKYVLSLSKADPSAKTYTFQYRWDKNETNNLVSFSFDTPDSLEKRMFDAVLNLSNTSSTASLTFQSAENTLQAKGVYRNTDDDKSLEASLDIDGRKHFDTVMSLKKHDIPFGYVWLPHAYWVINDERIAELSGLFKVKSKGGVTQIDILTDFQTKQLASHLIGYYTINGPTYGLQLNLDYQFYGNQKQTIKMEGVYSERPLGYRHDLYGELAMQFTAYPVYNFYSVLRNVKTQSHMDVSFNVSSSREESGDPSLMFDFTRIEKLSGVKLATHLTIARPRPVRMNFQFEQIGSKYLVVALLNVNPRSRDIAVSGALFYPPGTQLFLDAELNATLPTLHDCSVQAKVHETKPNEFQVYANGIWFTGVDFKIDALYQDQSKTNMASHHVKVVLNSNHFKDIAVDARFTQDNRQITFIGQGEYNEDRYRTLIRYVLISEQNFTAYVEVDANDKAYSATLNADLSNNTNVNMDIHFDQLRDVHISYQRWLSPQQKRLAAAFNWDANRDPSQRVSVDVQLDNLGAWHHAGHATLYYPGRVLNGEFQFLLRDWFCEWRVLMGWSDEANILWRVKMFSEAKGETVYALLSNMNTPFPGWSDTSFNLMWRYHDNLQAVNGSMNWQEDYLAFSLLADYLLRTDEFYGELAAVVNSTIPTLPRASAVARHRVLWKKSADTLLSFQYNEDGMLMINSSWVLDRGPLENNVTGRVTLVTPFPGYTRGFLKTRFVFGHKKDIHGVTFLDLEEKILKIYVNGHMRRITNCMLVVNVTSPVSEAPRMTARFGFVEPDRHLVAMVVTANSTTGIEILLKLVSTQDFHAFGHVALPIQYLNRAMITAKRAKEEVDFRVGWGAMDFGFTGIWHYRSPINFVYVYKLYTPLEGFEENGLVLKNVYGHGLDLELSVRLSTHKFGIAVLFIDNGKGLIDVISDRFRHVDNTDENMFIENFDTTAQVTLDTLYYPTVTFHAHIMKFVGIDEEDVMELNATLHLPDKPAIVLTDIFVLSSYTQMTNTLNLVTPFPAIMELKSLYTVDIEIGQKFNITYLALLYNGTYWHEISSKVFYSYDAGEDDAYESYVAALGVITPLPVLPALEARVQARLEDALWRMSADIAMPAFTITALGQLELDDPFVETSGSLNLTSDYLEDYFIKMEFKKDFADTQNTVGGGIQIQQGEQNNYLFATAVWRAPPERHVRFGGSAALHTVLPPSDLALVYTEEGGQRLLTGSVNCNTSHYSLRADQRPTSLSVALSTPHENLRTMTILGEFDGDNIKGSFVTDTAEYDVTGQVLHRDPLEMSLILIPKGQGDQIAIRVRSETTNDTYALSAQFSGPVQATLRANAEFAANFTDVSFKVDIPQAQNKEIFFKSRVDAYPSLRRVLSVQAATPLKRLKTVKADADFTFGPKTGYLLCKYEIPDMQGDGDLKWSFLLGDLFIKALGKQNLTEIQKSVDLDIYFGNNTAPDGLVKTDAGFKMDLDQIWQIGANATFGVTMGQRINLVINAILPKPNVDVHTLFVDGYAGNPQNPIKAAIAEYRTDVTGIRTGIKGKVLLLDTLFDGNATLTWTSEAGEQQTVVQQVDYKWDMNGSHFVDLALVTPMYEDDTTLTVVGSYQKDMVHGYQIVKGSVHQPGASRAGELDVRYNGARHSDGHFNLTTPFRRLPWLKSIFDINNLEERSDNKLELFWGNNTAAVNSTHQSAQEPGGWRQAGAIALSVPLSSQHLVLTDYIYIQGEKVSTGNATVDLDLERFVSASFRQVLSKSERDLDLATTDIEVVNDRAPVGVQYVHEFDDSGNTDVKQATVFHLTDPSKFNLTGKMDVFTFDTGKNVKLLAIHGNRTLTFENQYRAQDKELTQGSKVQWAADTWINYDIHITNMTTDETESQQLIMNVWYPLRTFNLVGVYRLQDVLLDGKAVLNWNVRDENKTAELRGKWENPPTETGNVHDVDLALSHPSFRKDVTLKGQYISSPTVMSNVSLELQYSDYDNEYLRLRSVLTDNSNGPVRDYQFELKCTHPSTNLDLDMKSDINIESRWYYFNNYYKFQKTLFYQKLRHSKLLVDMNNSAVQWERANETYFYKVNGTWDLTYPDYRLFTWVKRPTGNDTGLATLSMKDRSLIAHFNSTDDISYHVVGMIVDTRAAQLNAWRNFDDVATVDLASYIRLNHSRLLTSSVVWRPTIFTEVKSQAVYGLKYLYAQINETLVILKEAPMESHLALKAIWNDAKPRIRDFLDDLNDLHVIKDDLDEFETFLNKSYNANDFYVKDVVEFTYYVLDEMAIRNHLESLPGIVNDMWGMMGNTSQSIKQSLTYVVDTIKMAYANFLESANKVLDADFMDLVSSRLESMILQYDTFVRDLHMKLLEYWDSTWVNATSRLAKYWHQILKSMEPLFFKILHYTESFVFTVWRGVMDFFYNRTQELTDNPYFNYVSTFGHEMDKIYKDLVSNDLVTNIKKYTNKFWNVIWGKIEKYIPFKDEFLQLYAEFRNAWQNFLRTPQVVYVREKYKEAYERLKWWYDYFMIGEACDRVLDIVYAKLTDMAKTALQYEELHRTPKTNFIFDPRKGEILLEQKLPMSWHAFNRTPDFTEVAEYRAVRDFMDDWLTTNKSIWSYYYEIRPYMDINNVMPPFAGMAMMTGQGTLVTFDKRVLTLSEPGTFLLTKDYRQNNFSVLMESNAQGRYNLLVLTAKNLIHVDLYKEQVSIGSSVPLSLPAVVDEYVVDRQTDTLTISAQNGLEIQCNLMFHTCKLHVTGWYFASLGGLLGTYNNEQCDDLQLANGTVTSDARALAASWAARRAAGLPPLENREATNDTSCDKFFKNKVSPLHPCFAVIDANPFLRECLSGVDACALASTYLELCAQQHVPTHIPDHCVQCITPQGDVIEEGSFHSLQYVPSSTDVVFIVEAAFCNKNLRKAKNMDLFVEAYDSKFQQAGLSDNRYALVGYGGRGVFRRARALYVDNRLFTNAIEISKHFDSFTIEKADLVKGNKTLRADVFSALSFAISLPYRAGVARTLVLLPCGRCDVSQMRLDYSTMHHNLMENSVTLHILMDDDFMLSKKRANKYLFGVDSTLAYTNKDYERLAGDAGLRKQVKLPKEKLGVCTSLAMETNGTIFAGRKLQAERAVARRFATVAGARAALSAAPCSRAPRCECRDARLHCRPCLDAAMMEPFWTQDDLDDLIDQALDPVGPALS